MMDNGYFFCYLGFRALFMNKDVLMRHYVNHHHKDEDRDDLKKWGISYDVLEVQSEDQKRQVNNHSVAITTRRREFKDKLYNEGLKIAKHMKNERVRQTIEHPMTPPTTNEKIGKHGLKKGLKVRDVDP